MKQGSVSEFPLRCLDRAGQPPALVNANDGVLPGNADLAERVGDCAYAVGIEGDGPKQTILVDLLGQLGELGDVVPVFLTDHQLAA